MNGRAMYLVRIDNRLVHGQVIEAWLPFTNARTLIVANDALAADTVRQEIMGLAIPQGVAAQFLPVVGAPLYMQDHFPGEEDPNVIILFATCRDARVAHQQGLPMPRLNIGNLHYGPGKRQVCAHVALSDEDKSCLSYFVDQGIKLDFRCVPNESIQVEAVW